MVIRGLLIDLDGTLADSISHLKAAFLEFLAFYHIQGTEAEFTSCLGATLEEIAYDLKAKYHLPESHEQLYKHYASLILEAYGTRIKAMPGAVKVIAQAKEKGVKLALVTAASEAIAKSFLSFNSIEGLFDVVVFAKKDEPGKPDPALFLRGLKELNLRPDEVVAIEDSLNGVNSARAAQCAVLWLTSNKAFSAENGIYQVRSWEEIGQWLQVAEQVIRPLC